MADDLTYEIYWTKDSSDEETDQELVHVPGVNDVGNKRPSVKMRARRTKEIKAKVPSKSPVIVEDLSPGKRRPLKSINKSKDNIENDESQQLNNMKSKQRPALKDLRPEDKKRVANLIRELARIGEEKENAEEQLQQERQIFEEKVNKLQDQYKNILGERETLQKQYTECQQILTSYQSQIASQQEKMSQTLSELVATPHKVSPDVALTQSDRRSRHQMPDPHTNGMYSVDPKSKGYSSENGLTRFQQDFEDDFKPEFASTDRSRREFEQRNYDYGHFPRLDERDLYSVRSELKDNYSVDKHHNRDLYVPPAESQRSSKKYNGLTPPDTYESRTAGGEFRPLTPVDSERGSEFYDEYRKLSLGSTNSGSNGYDAREEFKYDDAKPRPSENYASLPVDNHRGMGLDSHRSSLPAYTAGIAAPLSYSARESHRVNAGSMYDAQYPAPASLPLPHSGISQSAPKMLSSELRKQQLLIQREQLRLEQLRLKQRLKDQESQLSRKQEELKQQREIHEDRLRYFELHGKFPPYFSPFTGQSPTYKKKYSPKSSEENGEPHDVVSTNFPPPDDNTPLRRLDLDDEDIVSSINAQDYSRRSREENNSFKELNIGDHGSTSRHYDLYEKQEDRRTPSVLFDAGSTSLEKKDDYISPSRYHDGSGDATTHGRDYAKTPSYELEKRHTVDIGTSPLYADRSINTSPYKSPTQHNHLPDTRYTTESLKNPLDRYEDPGAVLSPKQQYNLPSEINPQRTSPPRTTEGKINGYGSSLTAIVDSMERTSIRSPKYDPHRGHAAKTPELFGSRSYGENDNIEQENNLIEEVFFLK